MQPTQADRDLERGRCRLPALALILLLLGAGGAWRWSHPSVSPLSEKTSIAGLPFDNIGGDSKWDRTEAKGFSGALTNLGHNQPHKQTPPKASGSEGVIERNLSAERGAYGTSCTQPQVSATCGLHDVIVELSFGLRHENRRAAKPTPPNAAATSDYVLPDTCVSVGPERQRSRSGWCSAWHKSR